MVYKKYKKKSGWKKHINLNTAQKALNVALATKRLLNVEHKVYALANSPTISTTGSITNLSGISQGDGAGNRDGDSIKVTSFNLRFRLTAHASSTNTSVRMIIFRGKSEHGKTFSISELLQSTVVYSEKARDERYNTKILFDKVFDIPYGTNKMVVSRNMTFRKIMNPHINYDSATTTVENGGFYLLLLSTEATNTPTLDYRAVTHYLDN